MLLAALLPALAQDAPVPARRPAGDVKPPARSEDGVFLYPGLESVVLVTEQDQQMLDKQRETIAKNDKRRAKADKARRDGYDEWENAVIATNYRQFRGIAEGEKDRHASSGTLVLERIQKIEKMKQNIIRFERFYDKDSEEVASLLSSLEDYYGELEADTYTANSLSGELTVRGADYSEAKDGWKITVYSELFGLAGLFSYASTVDYKEVVKKGGALLGNKGLGGLDKDQSVMVLDSLFARAAPVLFAKLSYKVIRGTASSQYRLIPVSLTLARMDNMKEVLSVSRSGLAQGSFFMTPQLAVGSPSETVEAAVRAQDAATGNGSGARKGGGSKHDGDGKGGSSGKTGGSSSAGASGKKDGGNAQSGRSGSSSSSGSSGGNAQSGGISFTGKMLEKQKRRRVLLLTMDTAIYDFANYDINDLELNSMKLNFDFATSDYLFFGGGLAWRYMGKNTESYYGAFVNGGANITLFQNFRPYVQLEASANTGAELGLAAGGGLDITIKHLVLNANFAFNYVFDADLKKGNKNSTFGTAGFGIGFTW